MRKRDQPISGRRFIKDRLELKIRVGDGSNRQRSYRPLICIVAGRYGTVGLPVTLGVGATAVVTTSKCRAGPVSCEIAAHECARRVSECAEDVSRSTDQPITAIG